MRRGDAIFLEISDYLTFMINKNKVGNMSDSISNDKASTTLKVYGNIDYLFNKSFSTFNSKRGYFAEEKQD